MTEQVKPGKLLIKARHGVKEVKSHYFTTKSSCTSWFIYTVGLENSSKKYSTKKKIYIYYIYFDVLFFFNIISKDYISISLHFCVKNDASAFSAPVRITLVVRRQQGHSLCSHFQKGRGGGAYKRTNQTKQPLCPVAFYLL